MIAFDKSLYLLKCSPHAANLASISLVCSVGALAASLARSVFYYLCLGVGLYFLRTWSHAVAFSPHAHTHSLLHTGAYHTHEHKTHSHRRKHKYRHRHRHTHSHARHAHMHTCINTSAFVLCLLISVFSLSVPQPFSVLTQTHTTCTLTLNFFLLSPSTLLPLLIDRHAHTV